MAEPYEMLIVDDERIEREGIKSLIRKYQLPFHVAEACDGSAAKEFLQSHPVDVVFTDIVMPLCNGVELARWIRTAMPESITVIYSAYGEFEYAQKALEARVLKYVLKPLCPERFRAEMEEVALLCEQRRSRRREQEQWQRRKRRSALLRALYAPAEAPLPSWPDPRPRGMALLETADRFFDRSGDQLDAFCQTAFPGGDLLILNERQGLLLFPWEDGGLPPSRCVGYPERLLAGAAGSPILRRLRHAVFPSPGHGGPAFPAGGADGKRLFSPGKRPPVPGRPHRAPLGGKGRRTTLHPCHGGAGKAPQRPGFPPGPEPAHRLLRLPGSKLISKRPYRTLPWPGC